MRCRFRGPPAAGKSPSACSRTHPTWQPSQKVKRAQPQWQVDLAQSGSKELGVSQPSLISRRQHLAGLLCVPLPLLAPTEARAASTDLIEGTQNWFNIGLQSYGLWAQSLFNSISNDDQIGLTAAAAAEDEPRKRRFGSISIPGLSSFSFIHGTLVGGLIILLLAADKLSTPPEQQAAQHQQQVPQPSLAKQSVPLNPEVESALRRLLAEPEVSATFHDPAVHSALQDMRQDLGAINKYKNDPAVMQAFEKLLEIEDILERL